MGNTMRAHGSLLAAAVLIATLGIAPAAHADSARPHVIPIDPAAVDDPDALLPLYGFGRSTRDADPTASARCGNPAPDPVPDGQPIVVTIPPAAAFTVGAIPASYWKNP